RAAEPARRCGWDPSGLGAKWAGPSESGVRSNPGPGRPRPEASDGGDGPSSPRDPLRGGATHLVTVDASQSLTWKFVAAICRPPGLRAATPSSSVTPRD